MNSAVLASGNGSNFQAIVKACKKKKLKGIKVKLLIVDKRYAYARKRADKLGVKNVFVDPGRFKSRHSYEQEIIAILKNEKVDLVILAGFMRVLTPYFVKCFKNRILNIHPSLLPCFKGERAIQRAYNYGVKITGVTVHFVDDKVDHGPIILQKALIIEEDEGLRSLKKRIHRLEHILYPQAIDLYFKNRVKIHVRKVKATSI